MMIVGSLSSRQRRIFLDIEFWLSRPLILLYRLMEELIVIICRLAHSVTDDHLGVSHSELVNLDISSFWGNPHPTCKGAPHILLVLLLKVLSLRVLLAPLRL